jgi:hypothetical protein
MKRVLAQYPEDKYGKISVNLWRIEQELVDENLRHIVGYYCHECHANVDAKVGKYSVPIPTTHNK